MVVDDEQPDRHRGTSIRTRVPSAGRTRDADVAPQGGHPGGEPVEAEAGAVLGQGEPPTVVAHLEPDPAGIGVGQLDDGLGRGAVPSHVGQRLLRGPEQADVDGPAERHRLPVDDEPGPDRRLARHGGDEPVQGLGQRP